jgi:hypothetical protein
MVETRDERKWGYYDWQEVHDADRKLRELKAVESATQPPTLTFFTTSSPRFETR